MISQDAISFIKKPLFQYIGTICTFVLVGILLTTQYKKDYFAEKNYPIETITKKEKRLSSKINMGMHINNFPKFDIYQNSFILDALIWFKFPVGTESLTTIDNFEFQNGNIIYKSNPIISLDEQNVTVSYMINVDFLTYMKYQHFPLSDHKINIIFENRNITPNEIYYEIKKENFTLSDNLMIPNWNADEKHVNTGFIKANIHNNEKSASIDYPSVVFTIDFKNKSFGTFILLYLPLFLIFFIGFFSLYPKITETGRLSAIGGASSGLVLYKFVIDGLSPSVGTLTKIDQIYFLLVLLSIIILFFQAYLMFANKTIEKMPKDIQRPKINVLNTVNTFVIFGIEGVIVLFLLLQTFVW